MTLTITDRAILSPVTPHSAERLGQGDEDTWRVSWLPGRVLTGPQAEAARDVDVDCDPELYDDGVLVPRGRAGRSARNAGPGCDYSGRCGGGGLTLRTQGTPARAGRRSSGCPVAIGRGLFLAGAAPPRGGLSAPFPSALAGLG